MAHLVQHLSFGKCRSLAAGELEEQIQRVGGVANSRTDYDYTVFTDTVPSNALERILWLESERTTHLQITAEGLQTAKETVRQQYKRGILDNSNSQLDVLIPQYSFLRQYKMPVIGLPDEVEKITLTDVQAFYKHFYRPDNTVLVVAGDFDQGDLDGWVDQHFASIPRAETLPVRIRDAEPVRTGEQHFQASVRGLPLPMMAVTYLLPPVTSTDMPAFEILQAALSTGESSRFEENLVNSRHIAANAVAYTDLHRAAGLFVLRMTLSGGRKTEEAERALLGEIAQIQQSVLPVSDLERAKNLALADRLRQRETLEGRAESVGYAAVLQNDPQRVHSDMARILSVTAADVQRIAEKYLRKENRTVITIVPDHGTSGTSPSIGLQSDGKMPLPTAFLSFQGRLTKKKMGQAMLKQGGLEGMR